jgi:hypothetical protein
MLAVFPRPDFPNGADPANDAQQVVVVKAGPSRRRDQRLGAGRVSFVDVEGTLKACGDRTIDAGFSVVTTIILQGAFGLR